MMEVELSYEPSCPLVILPVGWLVSLYAIPKRAGSYTSMLLSDHLFTEGLRRNHGPVQEPVEVWLHSCNHGRRPPHHLSHPQVCPHKLIQTNQNYRFVPKILFAIDDLLLLCWWTPIETGSRSGSLFSEPSLRSMDQSRLSMLMLIQEQNDFEVIGSVTSLWPCLSVVGRLLCQSVIIFLKLHYTCLLTMRILVQASRDILNDFHTNGHLSSRLLASCSIRYATWF